MGAERTLYYATNRKGSRNEPGRALNAQSSFGRQEFFGPHRSETLTYGSYCMNGGNKPTLERLSGGDSIPVDDESDVLIFVHGFNCQFATDMDCLAELSEALQNQNGISTEGSNRKFVSILYSWPSMGSPFAYMQDECSAQFSYTHFKEFLNGIRKRIADSSNIHIVAHSLGCQLIYRYLLDGEVSSTAQESKKSSKVGTVIFSCPDLDYQTVSIDIEREKLAKSIERGFILVSDVDSPLELSRALHGYTRLGRPALPSSKSLFWGTFRTGSIANIVSTAAHAPEIIARRAITRLASGFRDPDKVWQEENRHRGIEFSSNIKMYDFTIADKGEKRMGHTLCIPLIVSLLSNGCPPHDWSEETIVKIPDEFVECTLVPYARSKPYENDNHRLFNYQKLTPPVAASEVKVPGRRK